jgi:tetratricopeptide (TPR) repeat protein
MELLAFLKEYWFLITLIISLVTAISYMIVFHVSPWEKYKEISERKEAVAIHLALGQKLLDDGHHQQAAREFELALRLEPANPKALEGKRKADLLLEVDRIEWKPGLALAYIDTFRNPKDHTILLFLGRVFERIGETHKALEYYENARTAYRDSHAGPGLDYYAALERMGWMFYMKGNLDEMERCFTRMKEIAQFDYRGYHGLGYALYMKAYQLAQSEQEGVTQLLTEATNVLYSAAKYVPNFLMITMDIGEVARLIDPNFSIFWRERAMKCIVEEELCRLEENKSDLTVLLFGSNAGDVVVSGKEDKIAWVKYQLALDHYVKAVLADPKNPDLTRHDSLVDEGKKMQKSESTFSIYEDQRTIVDTLLAKR